MRRCYLLFLGILLGTHLGSQAQTAITCTDTLAARIMMGLYDPAPYIIAPVLNDPATIAGGVHAEVSPDSMHAYLEELRVFKNRNSGSDTTAATNGIGAVRRWAFERFSQFSTRCNNRLIPSYLQFDMDICGTTRHRNIIAVLPGSDTADRSIVIIEAHIDSRCEGLCDTACDAQGMEDNGSGTALVLELARVMSKYTYKRTIVFALVIGEEQGLLGANALALYAQQHGIKIRGVLNNDVIGGVFCGHTSSPPSCPGYKNVDSTQVRLFSSGIFNSFHKGLARFIKLEYKEMVLPSAAVPMLVSIMSPEDRTGRGGDHIPFRQLGFTAMRFTAANENGDANSATGTYMDRQHASADSLGVDVTGDGVLDSFFVDFNYLARNTVINANAAAMMAVGPLTPDFTLTTNGINTLTVNITTHPEYLHYRIGVRTTTNDWDSVYTFTGVTSHTFSVPTANYKVSVASVDSNGIESLFSRELMANVNSVNGTAAGSKKIELLQNKPNPADEFTAISVVVSEGLSYKEAYISICDLNGREIKRTSIKLDEGVNEILYEHGYNMTGIYMYTLVIDGRAIESRRMVFIN
ncbi:MAG: M28 family peptidase [Bacteroidota bacterium]